MPLPFYLAANPDDAPETSPGQASSVLPTAISSPDGKLHRSVQPGTPFSPLTTKQKARVLLLSTFQPETLLRISATAGLASLRDSPSEWPGTFEGYTWRFADRVGQRLVYKNTEFLVGSVLLHEDPRYYLAEDASTGAKLKSAWKQTWLTRRDSGKWAPAWGSFAAAYTAGVVSAQWMPESRQTAESILIRSSAQIGFRFANNLFREFVPELRKKFRH